MQYTYYNETHKHVSLYANKDEDYVAFVAPATMISFNVDVKPGQAVLIKQWSDCMVYITAVDVQHAATGLDVAENESFGLGGEP